MPVPHTHQPEAQMSDATRAEPVLPGTPEVVGRRLVQLTDVDGDGRRWPVLVTADPYVVAATERAVRRRVREHLGGREPR